MKQRIATIVYWICWTACVYLLSAALAVGQVVNDRSERACLANKVWLEKCWQQGVVARVPCGTLYLRDVVETPVTVGCGRIETNGSGGYWIPSDHPTLAGKTSRICQLTPGKPVLRLRGAGFILNGPLYLEGNGDAAAIEVEGRHEGVATGQHRLSGIIAYNWRQVAVAKGGYYKDGQFVADESHADNSWLDCITQNCDTILRLENQQALNWNVKAYWQGTTRGGEAVALDIQRGGSVTADIVVENAKCKILRLGDYSDNQCTFDVKLWFDGMVDPNPEFTLVEMTKPDQFWCQWFINMRGWVSKQAKPIPQCLTYNVPANMNRTGWDIDLDYVGKQKTK